MIGYRQYCVDVVGIWKLFRFNKVPLVYYSVPSVHLCICIVCPVPERLRTNTHTVTAPGVLQDYLFLTGLLAYFSVEATVLTEVVLHLVFKLNSEITYTHQVQIMYVTKHRLTKFVFNYTREPMFTQWYLNLYLRTSVTQHIH